MADTDILIEILKSKEKLWSDKKRLGILTGSVEEKNTQHATLLQNSRQDEKARLAERLSSGSPGFGRKHPHKQSPQYPVTLPEDVRDKKKAELISKLIETPPIIIQHLRKETPKRPITAPDDLGERKKTELISKLSESEDLNDYDLREELMSPSSMVRFGEYSPLNPSILSPGKTLLGLGDWEEKRRQILERKKKEYMELMSQARQEAAQQQPHFCSTVSKSSVGTQTDLTITGYTADVHTPPGSSGRSPGNPPSSHSYLNVATATQTAGGNVQHLSGIKLPERSSSPYLPLSPRERKVAETYSPSFLINHNVLDGFTSPQEEEQLSEIARRRREAYQDELRKQIEEKRRLEAERLERERREEEALARRAEQQRERMRQEYELEEARRRELKIQRTRQAEEFQRRQEELRLQEELEREMQARRRLEKRLADLEAGLNSHNLLHSQAPRQLERSLPAHHCSQPVLPSTVQSTSPRRLEALLPVPALRTAAQQYPQPTVSSTALSTSPRKLEASLPVPALQTAAQQYPQPTVSSTALSTSPRRLEASLPVPALQTAAQPTLPSTALSTSPRRLEASLPVPALRSTHSPRETVPPPTQNNPVPAPVATLSYHRPPTEILRAAGYPPILSKSAAETTKSCSSHPTTDGSNTGYNPELYKPNSLLASETTNSSRSGLRKSDTLSAPETGNACSNHLLVNDTSNVGKSAPVKLDDTLPIPVLRAPSPVIPASRRKSPKEGSEAMRRLEAKWEVPAVEKNIVFGSNPNNILTQLGAVRHRMQLEQQRMEQYLKQKS